jgi:hypothetical protein
MGARIAFADACDDIRVDGVAFIGSIQYYPEGAVALLHQHRIGHDPVLLTRRRSFMVGDDALGNW